MHFLLIVVSMITLAFMSKVMVFELAHAHSFCNRMEVLMIKFYACFHSFNTFSATEMHYWTDFNSHGVGETTLWPEC